MGCEIYNSIKNHKKDNNFLHLIWYFVVSLVLFLICLYFQITSFDTINLYESNQNSKIYGNLCNGQVIIQEFISPLDSFQKIGLQIATYHRNGIDGEIFASVYVNNKKRNEQIISGRTLSDWCWVDIDIDGQVKKGDVIKLEISLTNKKYPIALMVHDTKNEKSVIKINESTLKGITSLRVAVKRSIQLAWLFWITFNLVFIFIYLFMKGSIIKKVEAMLILLCFFSCLMGAMLIPVAQCPDEASRALLSQWMVRNHSLPEGNEMDTMIMDWGALNAGDMTTRHWGFSYALRPFLASIVGALFHSILSLFTGNPTILLAASRICSVLSVTLCCWFCLRLGHRCFSGRYSSFLFAAFVCFLPQVQFLGMYQNNDALSLCAVSAVWYYLAEGFDTHWRVKCCIWLAVWLSVGALSYYIAYPWFLMGIVFFVFAVVHDREISEKSGFILRRGGLVAGICLVLAGWFFVRNAMLHQGDFLGMAEEVRSRARLLEQGYLLFDYHSAKADGIAFLSFLKRDDFFFVKRTIESFFGVFGYLNIDMSRRMYSLYYFITAAGVMNFCRALFAERLSHKNCFLALTGAAASMMVMALHTWHSYARDFQAQGRYIITVALLLGFLIAWGVDMLQSETRTENNYREFIPLLAGLVWLVLFGSVAVPAMSKMM